MTDAENMREAAALYHDERAEEETTLSKKYRGGSNPWFSHCQAAKAHMEYAAAIRALPIVDASAPAADCQQAELVTVDAGLLDEVKAALRTASESLEWCARGRMASASLETYPTLWAASTRAALARLEREVG